MRLDVFVVREEPGPDSPVYRIKAENGKGPAVTFHTNMLLPVQFLPAKERKVEPTIQKLYTRITRATRVTYKS